jgi:glutathione S-transferase
MAGLILWTDSLFASPWAHVAWVALKEKGLPFSVQTVDIESGNHRQGEYARRSLSGRIPALHHGELWLGESLAIVEYLEEAYPPPKYPALLPVEPTDRAREREIRSWLRTALFELRRCLPYEHLFVSREPPPAMTDQARLELAHLTRVASVRWRDGLPTPPRMADIELGFMLRRPIHHGLLIPVHLREIADALWWRPSVASWVELDRSTIVP